MLLGLGTYFGATFGAVPGREVIALSLILLFGTSGFLLGYLLTRLYLAGAFSRALTSFDALKQAVALSGGTKEREGDVIRKVEAAAANATQQEVEIEVRRLALEYDEVRRTMPFTRQRTARLDAIVARMKGLAQSAGDMLDKLTGSANEGDRLAAIAFLQMAPDPKHIGWLGGRFGDETPFVKYHAARALRHMAEEAPLSGAHKTELQAALERAREGIPKNDKAALESITLAERALNATT